MNSAEVMMILTVFLTMKATIGQPPENCGCYRAANPSDAAGCDTLGCSLGTNLFCDDDFDRAPYRYAVLADLAHSPDDNAAYRGCNCPGSPSSATHNGYYGSATAAVSANATATLGFDYNTCTSYGGNARDRNGNVPPDANEATDCCNFCCNRNDPRPSSAREIILNKSLYLSGLTMLVLTILKIN